MDFTCCCIAPRIDLAHVRRAFELPDSQWKLYVTLGNKQLSQLLLTQSSARKLYIFASGCLVFQDFTPAELLFVVQKFEQIVPKVDYRNVVSYLESVTTEELELHTEKECQIASEVVPLYLAKSVSLDVLNKDLDRLLENEELLIQRLKDGKSWLNIRFTTNMRIRMIQFQYKALHHARFWDANDAHITGEHAQICVRVYEHLSLKSRQESFQTKFEHVKHLLSFFAEDRLETTMMGCFRWEVILLVLFPILHYIPAGQSIANIVDQIKNLVAQMGII